MAKKKNVEVSEERALKGVGRKLAIYIPNEDGFVLDELEHLRIARAKAGYRTSLSYELIRLVKLGLRHADAQKV